MAELKKFSDTLVLLIQGTNAVAQDKLEEALRTAKNLNCPLQRALSMLGYASDHSLKSILEAQTEITEGRISLDTAVKALRFAKQNNLEFDEAVNVLTSVHKKTMVAPSITNTLTNLLLDANMITREQLGSALQRSLSSGMTIGRLLVLNRDLSSWMMIASLNALLLVRDQKIVVDDAINGLQAVGRRRITIEQALFELGLYREGPGQSLKLGELFQMSGFLGESDMLECLEIELVKEKSFGQILLEQGLATSSLLEAAVYLQDLTASDTLRGYQAAEALRSVRTKEVSVYQAVAELQPPPQVAPPILRFTELMQKAGTCGSAESIKQIIPEDEDSSVKAGKKLLAAGLVNDVSLYTALRTYSLLREGYVTNDNAVLILQHCKANNVNVDDALIKLGLNIPSRMQWLWV
ncbi:MAG: hypothetical protein P4L53_02735 [Candidatus Obscuribacterales bacterium]|nr:hypothetical protein [Candidatus Obscuribacterales bacterium]